MNETLLDVRNLSVVFPTRHQNLTALDGISFQLKRGEILGFVGESGAGKSMTGAAIMGLIDSPGRITGGEIFFDGARIDLFPQRIRGSKIGMVFQDPLTSLNPLKKIGHQLSETISFHMKFGHAEAKERALALLQEVGIGKERYNAYPHQFSGGMRQRVVIALALAAEPDIIIADEPTTALDVSIQAQILDLLKTLCKEKNTSVILITHDMGVISETTDRVAVFYAGRIVEIGKTEDLLSNPRHPYSQGLIASTPKLDTGHVDDLLMQIDGNMPTLANIPSGCAFHPRCLQKKKNCSTETPKLSEDGVACLLYQGKER